MQLAADLALLFAGRGGGQSPRGFVRFCVLPAWAESKLLATLAAEVYARLAVIQFWPHSLLGSKFFIAKLHTRAVAVSSGCLPIYNN